MEARRAGEDVIDLGFGNPDLPVARHRRREAGGGRPQRRATTATRPSRASRSSAQAVADLYQRRFGVELDPETEVITTIGAKEGFVHLMWTLLQPGDAALVPTPSYPIHIYGPIFAGADRAPGPAGPGRGLLRRTSPRRGSARGPSHACSCSPSRTTRPPPASTSPSCSASSTSPASTTSSSCTTSPTPTSASTATSRRRSCRCRGPKECAVELYSLTKSFSMAGLAGRASCVGNAEIVAALAQAQVLPRLRHVPAHPDRRHRRAERGARVPPARSTRSTRPRRDVLCDGLDRIGWEVRAAPGHDVRLGADPRAVPGDGLARVRRAAGAARRKVAVSPGIGFGPGGEGHVRFALVENEHRIRQAVRGIRRVLEQA